MKRSAYLVIGLFLCLTLLSSCFREWDDIPERTAPDPIIPLFPNYTENYTYKPVIKFGINEYRVDEYNRNIDDSPHGNFADEINDFNFNCSDEIKDFKTLDYTYRNSPEHSLIVYGTVIDNPVQKEVYSYDSPEINDSTLLCPFKIKNIIYSSEGVGAFNGEIIELSVIGSYFLYRDGNGEIFSHIGNYGMPFISGGEYLLYLTYSAEQPAYEYERYTVNPNAKFEVTNYSESFEFKTKDAREPNFGPEALRCYDLHKVSKFIHDKEKYPPSASLASVDDVKTLGIRIGNTVIEGFEESVHGLKYTGNTNKNGEYIYDRIDYEQYDTSSGVIPNGCPIFVCDYNEDFELVLEGELVTQIDQCDRISDIELLDLNGERCATYYCMPQQPCVPSRDVVGAGIYFLQIILFVSETEIPPQYAQGEVTPEVGKEYIIEKSYLFAIVMD